MERQPAKINYFFGPCYHDLGNTIKNNFIYLGRTIADCGKHIADVWKKSGIFNPVGATKIGFWLGLLVCLSVISTSICIVFSVVHIIATLVVMLIIYILFSLLWLLDSLMCKIRQIRLSCPKCQYKFPLPHYMCPKCGRLHTKLKPSKYGILKRECDCGNKLPTTFFNGRQKLPAICPKCKYNLPYSGYHVNISIPVIGGPSSGKTCFINMALAELEKIATPELNYDYQHIDSGTDPLKANLNAMQKGYLPQKTSETRLVYYEFYFSPKKSKVKNQISLCDVGGEVYSVGAGMDSQIGYSLANGFLMIIDPLSLPEFKREASRKGDVSAYNASSMPIDSVLGMLVKTLEDMRKLSPKQKINENFAIVFTKCDMPEVNKFIGEDAVTARAAGNDRKSRMDATNMLCEEFLMNFGETGFVNLVKSRFSTVQYFACSALGHNVNGTAFKPTGVADPILWLIDKQSPTINFKNRWNS